MVFNSLLAYCESSCSSDMQRILIPLSELCLHDAAIRHEVEQMLLILPNEAIMITHVMLMISKNLICR